jgi:RsiW-degrading membrane proteinase PrsW (M82 family)
VLLKPPRSEDGPALTSQWSIGHDHLMSTGSRRSGSWNRHLWFAVLLVGGLLFYLVLRTLQETQNPNLVPSLILLGAFLIPVTFVTFIYQRVDGHDRVTGTSPDLIALAALFGGVIGVVVAGRLEYDTMRDLGTVPMLAVGLIEEGAKLIVPIAILLLLRSRRPKSGLLVGVSVGMGFAALETMGYAFTALLASKGSIGAVEELLLLRGVLSPAAHAAWTGLSTAALWHAADSGRVRGYAGFVLAYLGVAVLHACWDGIGTWWAYLILSLISLGLVRRRVRESLTAA